MGFGLGLEDLEKELEIEEALKSKEKIPVSEEHSCSVKEEIVENTEILTENNLTIIWNKLMEWFKTNEQVSLYELLSGNKPSINEKSLILTLDSAVEKEIIENNLGQIKGFLKRHFIDFQELTLEITTSTKSKKLILNQKDKFIKLANKNPWLNKMREELNLELEM